MSTNKSLAELITGQTELTKETISNVSDVIVNEFNSGKMNQLEFLGKMEFMAQAIDKAMQTIRQQALEELEKYGAEAKFGVVRSGITFKTKEAGVKYDYSNTKKWVDINDRLTAVKEEMKSLESQLKTIKGKQILVDEDTGECVELMQPIKTSKTTIEISIPNK